VSNSLLIASHSYILAGARGKVRELSRLTDLTLLVPHRWTFELLKATAEAEADAPFQLVIIPVILPGRNIRYIYGVRSLVRTLRRVRPRVVLVEEEPTSLALAQFSLLRKQFDYHLFFFTWENIYWQPQVTRWVERLNFKAARGAIAGSQEAARFLRAKGFQEPVKVIPQMGIDPVQFQPPGEPRQNEPFTIGYVGRITKEKGLQTLFQAVAHLPGDWTLHMIGNGPLRSELESEAHRAGWTDRLHWLDFVPRDKLPAHLQQMHVLVLPSRTTSHWKEQFGRVLIEAMACGVPIVGSDSGAIPEVVGDAGLIFPEGDSEVLRQFLISLMENPSLLRGLSTRAVERVRAHFTDQVIAKSLQQFLFSGVRT